MSVWQDNGSMRKVPQRGIYKGLKAFLCCPGPSLKDAPDNLQGPGRVVMAINTAYPKVRPDVWIGMDDAHCYDSRLLSEPFPKYYRGGYQSRQSGGRMLKEYPATFFLDCARGGSVREAFTRTDEDDHFIWTKNTMAIAIHFLIWAGVSEISLVGCDMGGAEDYWNGNKLTDDQRKTNRRLYSQQIEMMRQFRTEGKMFGVSFVSCTKDSPLNGFLPYEDLTEKLAGMERTNEHSQDHAIVVEESRKRATNGVLGVVVPTRGDRTELMRMCRSMIDSQTRQPDHVFVIDSAPVIEGNDQRDRVQDGVAKAKAAGCTHVLVMEDDDYYPPNYIEKVLANWKDEELVGGYYYDIYHIMVRKHLHYHADMNYGTGIKGAPLHSTGFTIGAWDRFLASGWLGKRRNLDEEVWGWAQETNVHRGWIKEHLVLSIKHGIGKQAGGNHGHSVYAKKGESDHGCEYLESIVGGAICEEYKKMYVDFSKHTLAELASDGATDKATSHSYIDVYGELFSPIRDTASHVLELGVERGGSILLWQRYFTKATVTGVDTTMAKLRAAPDPARCRLLTMDAYCDSSIAAIQDRKYDVIIDDGPHTLSSVLYVAANYTGMLAKGGILVIEDIQDIENVSQIIQAFPASVRQYVKVVDRRNVKGRKDDILVVLKLLAY